MKAVTFTKRAIQGLVGTLAVAASFGAWASPVVTLWGFEVNSGFSAFLDSSNSPAGITASNGNPNLGGMPSLLSWGAPATPAGQSSLGVGAATNGVFGPGLIITNAAAVDTVQVIHNNFPVFAPTLKSANLFDLITLQALSPSVDPAFNAAALNFGINFLETPNIEGTCVAPSPAGNPCNDIFVINVAGAGFDPITKSLVQGFLYDTNWYAAVLSISGLGTLTDAECFAAGAASKCIGFTTEENKSNVFQVSLAINAVPEPGSLALFGLALVGLGMVRRRKNVA